MNATDSALAVECPVCGAEPDEPCRMQRPPYDECQHPHRERTAVARSGG